MSRFEQLDAALKSRGWRYDVGEEQFFDGERLLDWEEVIGLVPDFTLDELASYQDDKYDRLCARRTRAKA